MIEKYIKNEGIADADVEKTKAMLANFDDEDHDSEEEKDEVDDKLAYDNVIFNQFVYFKNFCFINWLQNYTNINLIFTQFPNKLNKFVCKNILLMQPF